MHRFSPSPSERGAPSHDKRVTTNAVHLRMFVVTIAVLCGYLAPPTRTVRHAPVVVRHTSVVASEAPPAEELIAAAKHFMNEGTGYYSAQDESLFAEDYVFRGPSIGPLNKRDYTSVMQYFMMYEAFEDFSPNAFGYTVRLHFASSGQILQTS